MVLPIDDSTPFNFPSSKEEVENLIRSQAPEDIHLDYKRSEAIDHGKKNEIAKDVSAFANSDGGVIIYGIIERNNIPNCLDDGVDHQKFSREWLDQVIQSNISPRVDGIRISQIPLSPNKSLYAILIPLGSNSKCNTLGPNGLRCCHADQALLSSQSR